MTKKRAIKSLKTNNESLSANAEEAKKIEEIKNILKQLPLKDSEQQEKLDKWANELYKILFTYDRSLKKLTSSTSFIVTEYKRLFWNHTDFFSPYEKTEITFLDDGKYEIKKEKVFISPTVSKEEIAQVLNDYTNALEHIKKGISLDDPKYKGRFEIYPYELLIAILNNSFEAEILFNNYMLGKADGVCAESYMNAYNILSEVREDKTN